MTVTTTGDNTSSVTGRSGKRTAGTLPGGTPPDPHHHRRAADQAIGANTTHLNLDVGPAHMHVALPPLDKLAFYVALAGAATFGVVEWPIAVLTGLGHALSDNRRHRTLRALGEAMDAV